MNYQLNDNRGFTLAEVMVSFAIFAMLVTGIIPAFSSLVQRNSAMEVRSGAMNAAQIVLDRLRLQDPGSLPSSGTSAAETVSVDGRDFSVTTSYCVNSAFCASANNRHLTVRVRYKGEQLFDVETVFTRLR